MRDGANGAEEDAAAKLLSGLNDVTVLLANPLGAFADDNAKVQALQQIIAPLSERAGVTIRFVEKSFAPQPNGTIEERYAPLVEKGRALLKEEDADLLMWGILESQSQAIRWSFLSAIAGGANLGTPSMVESMLVPFEPEPIVLDVLFATLFAATQPHHPTQAMKIGEHLLKAVDPLTKISTAFKPRLTSPEVKVSVMGMGAVVLANIARRAKDLDWYGPARQVFDTWENLVEKDKTPLDWALVKNHHGWLFEELANQADEADVLEHIEKSLSIFNDVCSVFTQGNYPQEWAAVQMRMAGTCARIGRQRTDPDYLQRAMRLYKQSQKVYNQHVYPLNWADSMTKMARVMMLHGQMVKGAQSLEQAGVAFQAALKVYEEDKYPAQWASTQNNLGATLFALAKRDPRTPEWLVHALMCFQNARGYYEEQRKNQLVHVIDKNIAKAQELKDDIETRLRNDLLN